MKTDDLIAASKEAFGKHPDHVLSPARVASDGFGWLNEILVSIRREAEGGNCALQIVKLAAAGACIAVDMENCCASEHEGMLRKLQDVGALPPDRRSPD